jgi:hypothetical protein
MVDNQRYINEDGTHTSFLEEMGGEFGGRYSPGLDALICRWCNVVSYENASDLLKEATGNRALTGNGLKHYVLGRATKISSSWLASSAGADLGVLSCAAVDIYSADGKEVNVMVDGVQVKAQKPMRGVARKDSDSKRIETTVGLVSYKSDTYHTITEGIDSSGKVTYPIERAIQDKIIELHRKAAPAEEIAGQGLPVVAITDGARSIRLSLEAVFGLSVCVILDWYHLSHKVSSLMSMIANSKEDKSMYISDLIKFLWHGNVADAKAYMACMPRIKNAEKHQELLTYLTKHEKEIIDYERRQKAGKTIGSGRCEKANDLVVAHRQKKKGMAWASNGSRALAILKVHQLSSRVAA